MTFVAGSLGAVFVWVLIETLAGRPLKLTNRGDGRSHRRREKRQVWLTQAGAAVTPAQFWAVIVTTTAAAFLVLYLIDRTLIVALLPAIGLGATPYVYWGQRRNRGVNARTEAWPEALRRINGALRRGHLNLHEALEELSISGPEALRSTFRDYVRLVNQAVTPTRALEALRASLADPVSDTVLLTLALTVTEGTATTLDVITDLTAQVTGDLEMAEGIRTAQTQSRIAAWGVFLLPYGVLVFFCATQGAYRDFYSQPIGLVFVLAGAVCSVIGFSIVRHLAKPIATVGRIFAAPDPPDPNPQPAANISPENGPFPPGVGTGASMTVGAR